MAEGGVIKNETETETGNSKSQSELPNFPSTYKLHAKNYLKWSQLVKTLLKGKGKAEHLTEEPPEETDPKFKKWDTEDSAIMGWLWSAMAPEISDTCMFLNTAKEIWKALEESYSKAKDAAQIYDVKVKTMAAKQGNKTVTEYANHLKALWMELDHYRVVKAKCSEDTTILKEYIEQDRVYDFLVGLNCDFDQVRVQILGKEKVPSINEVVAIVRSEESRRGLMLAPPPVESSAMLVEKNSTMIADQKNGGGTYVEKKGEETWCTYCNKPRHLRENCWKLKGKPPSRQWGKKGDLPKKGGQAHMIASTSEAGQEGMKQLNQDEIEKVRSFLSRLERPTGTSTLSHSGKFSFPSSFGKFQFSVGLNASDIPFKQYWILDSGATDHMTPLPKHFSTYSPCPSNRKISIADGTLLTVAGQGDVRINSSITLNNVLHIPKLSTSLISIQKLTNDLSCNVIFYNNSCVFQDQQSGRTIGYAREWNGLYYLDNQDSSSKLLNNSFFSESIKTNREKVLLYHCRLGHPSFRVIKQLFPLFFKTLDVESFHCEVCELAKHKRVPFSVSNKMSTFPFYLVHTDVWGPSNVPNISGTRWFVTFTDDSGYLGLFT
jgi:hypothetical protein